MTTSPKEAAKPQLSIKLEPCSEEKSNQAIAVLARMLEIYLAQTGKEKSEQII